MNTPGCPPVQTYNENQLQTAINDAGALAGEDRIAIGPGIYDDGPYQALNTNQLEIFGSGMDATTLRRAGFGDNQTVLSVANGSSTVRDLGIELTNGGNTITGLSFAGTASRVKVTEAISASGAPRTGIQVAPNATLSNSSVALTLAANTTAVSAGAGPGPVATLRENVLSAQLGVFSNVQTRAERTSVTAREFGFFQQGSLVLDHASIRIAPGGSANTTGVFTAPRPMLGGGDPANLAVRHVSISGPGAGSGILIASGCGFPNPNAIPLTGNATVRNSISRGFANDLRRVGVTCTDPVLPPPNNNIPAAANLTVAYSNYATVDSSTGSGTFTEEAGTNQSADPQFADAASGNLRLLQGSPAIDAGDPAAPGGGEVNVDQEGNARTQDGNGDGAARRDMGAYEHTFVPPTDTGGGDPGGGGDGGGDGGGPTEITRTLSLGYKDKTDKFKGALRSNETACLAGKVKVFEKEKGKDPKVGADKTNAAGKWSFEEEGADGKFYAQVPAKTVPAGTCPAAKSRAKRVG